MTQSEKNSGHGADALRQDLDENLVFLHLGIADKEEALNQLQTDIEQYKRLGELWTALREELTVENFTAVYRHIDMMERPADSMVDFWGYSKLSQAIYDSLTDFVSENAAKEFIAELAVANFQFKLTGDEQPLLELKELLIKKLSAPKDVADKPYPTGKETTPEGDKRYVESPKPPDPAEGPTQT